MKVSTTMLPMLCAAVSAEERFSSGKSDYTAKDIAVLEGIQAHPCHGEFIDIGTPESLAGADEFFAKTSLAAACPVPEVL